jgi:hypothetical protein
MMWRQENHAATAEKTARIRKSKRIQTKLKIKKILLIKIENAIGIRKAVLHGFTPSPFYVQYCFVIDC